MCLLKHNGSSVVMPAGDSLLAVSNFKLFVIEAAHPLAVVILYFAGSIA